MDIKNEFEDFSDQIIGFFVLFGSELAGGGMYRNRKCQ
jgi:hypothetical protein